MVEVHGALAFDDELADQIFEARFRAYLNQDAVAERMGTTQSALSRLESVERHAPSIDTRLWNAQALRCGFQVKLAPQKTA